MRSCTRRSSSATGPSRTTSSAATRPQEWCRRRRSTASPTRKGCHRRHSSKMTAGQQQWGFDCRRACPRMRTCSVCPRLLCDRDADVTTTNSTGRTTGQDWPTKWKTTNHAEWWRTTSLCERVCVLKCAARFRVMSSRMPSCLICFLLTVETRPQEMLLPFLKTETRRRRGGPAVFIPRGGTTFEKREHM